MNDILRVKNLNKSYKNFSLTDVSFSLPEGCITGLSELTVPERLLPCAQFLT